MRSMREPMGRCRWARGEPLAQLASCLMNAAARSLPALDAPHVQSTASPPKFTADGRRQWARIFFFKITLYENYFDNYTSGKLFLKMDP